MLSICRNLLLKSIKLPTNSLACIKSSKSMATHAMTDEEFDEKYIAYFDKKDIDNWEIRHGINDLIHSDVVPEPKIIISVLHACRRLNDYALTTRFLEAVKFKCGTKVGEIYPYIIQEITPVLKELGISTPEELGYDQPEFLLERPEYD